MLMEYALGFLHAPLDRTHTETIGVNVRCGYTLNYLRNFTNTPAQSPFQTNHIKSSRCEIHFFKALQVITMCRMFENDLG